MTFDALGLALAAIVAMATTNALASAWTVEDSTVQAVGASSFASLAKVQAGRTRHLPYDRADLP
jgi:hypothetical protein